MRLHVEPMDADLVEFASDGRVRFDAEDWTTPTLQETRAILYAAEQQIAWLRELVSALEDGIRPGGRGRRSP